MMSFQWFYWWICILLRGLIFPCDLAGYRAIPMVHWHQCYELIERGIFIITISAFLLCVWNEEYTWHVCISTSLYSPIEPLEWHHFLLVPIEPLVPMDHRNCPVPSQVTWENNLSPLNEMHIHQQNHWNDILFYWYQSYHWTIGLTNRIRLCILDMCDRTSRSSPKAH